MLRALPKPNLGLVAAGASLAADERRLRSSVGDASEGCSVAAAEELNGNTPREDGHRDDRYRDENRRFGKET